MAGLKKGRRQRVLVVDDEKNCRELLSQVLTEMGCDVILAPSGHEALQEVGKNCFDLVFTDLNMKGMDGWRLAEEIRRLNGTVPIVLVTGAEKAAITQKMRSTSIDEVVFKPFNWDDILAIISNRFPM